MSDDKAIPECVHVGIYRIDTQELIAGPLFYGNLPRQNDILQIDSVFHQVCLVEVDYKTQDVAKAYVTTIGDEDAYLKVLGTLAKR